MANFLPFSSKFFDTSINNRNRSKEAKKRRREKPSAKQLVLETLEERLVLTSPQLLSIVPSGEGLLKENDVLDVAPSELLLQFDQGQVLNAQTAQGAISIVRSTDNIFGNADDVLVTPGFVGLGDRSDQLVVRFADTLQDGFYRLQITGGLQNVDGEAFNGGQTFQRRFELDLAPRVVAVVPQPIDRDPSTGAIIGQRLNQVDVYFSANDPLNPTLAQDPRFYQLLDTRGTVDPTDDLFTVPTSAVYDAALNRVTLTFANNLANGTYRLRVGESTEALGSESVINVGTLYQLDTAASAPEYVANGYIGDNNGANDVDRYQINVPLTGELTVTVTPGNAGDQSGATLDAVVSLLANETYVLDLSTSTTGAFTLTYGSQTTGFALTPNATAGDIQFLLEALSSIGIGNVAVTQVAPKVFRIQFRNALGLQDTAGLTLTNAGTLDGTPSLTLAQAAVLVAPVNVNGVGGAETYTFTGLEPGTYVIQVSGANGATGSYRMEVQYDQSFNSNDGGSLNDNNTSLADAAANSNLGVLGAGGIIISAEILNDAPFQTTLPGSGEEPGIRDIPLMGEGLLPPGAVDVENGITRIYYSFPATYGPDPNGQTLINAITENQKQRAREIFAIFGGMIGAQFVEAESGGLNIITGDIRVADQTLPPLGVGGVQSGSTVIINALLDFGESEFGGRWQQIAFHEIGHFLGLGHAYHLPGSVMGGSESGDFDASTEAILPGTYDIAALQVLYAPESRDIDLYRFEVTAAGTFSAEAFAERLGANDPRSGHPDFGLLNTVLSLFDASGNLIARNDDYFSNDSFLKIDLQPGVYYVGVTSTGNTDYDPRIANSGFGGTTEGPYDLRLNFQVAATSAIADSDGVGTRLDGDADGDPSGAYNFWFQSGDTIFVDKSAPAGGNGSLNSPFRNIDDAIAAVANLIKAVDGSKINDGDTFVIGDGLNRVTFEFDNNGSVTSGNRQVIFTLGDSAAVVASNIASAIGLAISSNALSSTLLAVNYTAGQSQLRLDGIAVEIDLSGTHALIQNTSIIRVLGNSQGLPYLIGVDDNGFELPDGRDLKVPQGVTLMIDEGAIFKLQDANIIAGSTEQGVSRAGGAIQVLGTPTNNVVFTSYHDDFFGGDSDGFGSVQPGDWGGLVFREDSDLEQDGIFLNSVNHANIRYGGGAFIENSVVVAIAPIHAVGARPSITYNTIRFSAQAAISADADSFEETLIQIGDPNHVGDSLTPADPMRRTRADYDRVGLDISSNVIRNNTVNGLFIRVDTAADGGLDTLRTQARFDDTDVTHVLQETLHIQGAAGGPLRLSSGQQVARLAGRLAIDPGVVVKLGGARIEVGYGSNLIAEGVEGRDVIFTSIFDDRFGAGGVFDTTNDFGATSAAAGDWAGIYLYPTSSASFDHAYLAYGGGTSTIEGETAQFNVIEARQAWLRIASSVIENNAGGRSTDRSSTARNGRGANDDAAIFVRGGETIILNNIIRNNVGPAISIDVNSLDFDRVEDFGRSTGAIQQARLVADNNGALIRYNRLANNTINGMEVRGGILTTQGIWDDVDIVHVVRSEIAIPNITTYGGLRLESSNQQSLVVKLSGANAGFTAGGTKLDIDDRIGGSIQILGRPGRPVILTSLADDTAGAGFDPDGNPQFDTNNDGLAVITPPLPPTSTGGIFIEQGDAGNNLAAANIVTGATGRVYAIQGRLSSGNDVDIYRITIDTPAQFYATVSALSTVNNVQLFLFDALGNAVYANDDSAFGLDATLPAGHPFGPTTAGTYFLAVSAYNNDPMDVFGTELFDTDTNTQAVAGPNPAAFSFFQWQSSSAAGGDYIINLGGTQFFSEGVGPITRTTPVILGEQLDAGYLPQTAQAIAAPIVQGIHGNLDRIGDADVYRIYISDPQQFSASTVGRTFSGNGIVDTQLYLFDSTGRGIIASGSSAGGVEAAITAANAAPLLTPGYYYLAVAAAGTTPLDANSTPIFNMSGQPKSVLANPAAGRISSWELFGSGTGSYTIELTGVGSAATQDEEWWRSVITNDAAQVDSFIVTTDSPTNHIVNPGQGYDGVADLIVTTPQGSFRGAGSLLSSGRHILTAAHVVTDIFGFLDPTTTVQITFETPQGNFVYNANASTIFVAPGYDGNVVSSFDIAIIELSAEVDAIINRYDIMRSTDGSPLGEVHTKIGYGRSGTGTTGSILPSGTKRLGQNVYDAFGEIIEPTFVVAGTIIPGSILLYDFDNGNPNNDFFGRVYGINGTGLGLAEASAAPGDSGGPTFVNGLIAGVTSFGFGSNGVVVSDINGILDSSFGEFAGDVSTAFHAAWIDSIVGTTGGGGGVPGASPQPGDWRSVRLEPNSGDRNVAVVLEGEGAFLNAKDINNSINTAQFLGDLASSEFNANDNLRAGFQVHGSIAFDSPGDVDVYSFTAAAGTEVWIDIDRTDFDLDTVVEVIRANGAVIARSDNSLQLADGSFWDPNEATLPGRGLARELQKDQHLGDDFYGTNPYDAGLRLILPGTPGSRETYYVRVRSRGDDINAISSGKSRGEYQMQIRLQQVDEFPGSSIAFADMRYATNAVEVIGLPNHSPLTGETTESSVNNDTFDGAQDLGNLLGSDRASLTVGGSLSSLGDVDWYKFTVDFDFIQAIAGVNGAGRTLSTIFDIDYADGIARPDTTISVFDQNGNLILVARSSDIQDDQEVAGTPGVSDGDRGSFSPTDPYIGPVQLPEGDSRTYYVAISSNRRLPAEMDATFQGAATNPLVRLEPVNSVNRIAEDHIGYVGYAEGNGSSTASASLNPLFGTAGDNSATSLQTHAKAFTLADVTLFTTTGSNLNALVNPVTGDFLNQAIRTTFGGISFNNLTMRPDGVLIALTTGTTDGNSGNLLAIDPATGTIQTLGDDGVGNNAVRSYSAIAYRGDFDPGNANYDGWPLYAIDQANVLRRLNPRTGAQLNPNGSTTTPGPVGTIDFEAAGGTATEDAAGMAFIDNVLYVVTNEGRLYTVSTGNASATLVRQVLTGVGFRSLTRGPKNVQQGAFYNTLFATTTNGQLVALDTRGNLLPVFEGNTLSVNVGNQVGIAFTTLDYNLWHTTQTRRSDPGHGINDTFDGSRSDNPRFPDASYSVSGDNGTKTFSQDEGGLSWYFGLQRNGVDEADDIETMINQPDARNYRFRANQGISFLTDNYNTYDLPGGAKGSLITNSFSLADYTAQDRPTLYFNYFLETQGASSTTDTMRDAARVFVSPDGGNTWVMVATNNSARTQNSSELPWYPTAEASPSNDARQAIQELFDNTDSWRQARIDLSQFAGLDNLLLRFDFTTSGAMDEAGLPGNNFGDYDHVTRGQNNSFEGFYVDDIIIGLAERGEMVTGATGVTDFFTTPADPDPAGPQQNLTGAYQLEIRRGMEYGTSRTGQDAEIMLFDSINPNDLLRADSTLRVVFQPNTLAGLNIADGDTFTINGRTFEFEMGPTLTINNFALLEDGDTVTIDGTTYEFDSGLAIRVDSVPADGSTFEISGVTYEFDGNGTVTPGNTAISTDGYTAVRLAQRIADAVNFAQPSANARAVGNKVYIRNPLTPVTFTYGGGALTQLGEDGVSAGNVAVNFQFDRGLVGFFNEPANAFELAKALAAASGGNAGDNIVSYLNAAAITAINSAAIVQVPGSADGVTGTNVPILVHAGMTAQDVAAAIASAINGSSVAQGPDGIIVAEAGGDRVALAFSDNLDTQGRAYLNFNPAANTNDSDVNRRREQGHIQIANSMFTNSLQYGVVVDGGDRENGVPGNGVRNTPVLNQEGLAPSVLIVNNLFAYNLVGGLFLGGDDNLTQEARAASPFAVVINNTFYGSTQPLGIGVTVADNAKPTLINNIFSNFEIGISRTSGPNSVVVIASTFKGNTRDADFAFQDNFAQFLLPSDPLFTDPLANNFYLAAGSKAIDSSLNSLVDRPQLAAVKASLGFAPAPILAPLTDINGLTRQDDVTAPTPPGLGLNVFKDRGAFERADFTGPKAILINPEDNDSGLVDLDPDETEVLLVSQSVSTFEVQLTDSASGIDDATVLPSSVVLQRNGVTLVRGVDYTFSYDPTNDVIRLTSGATFFGPGVYTLRLNNNAVTGIMDKAGNRLTRNQVADEVKFTISIQATAPPAPVAALQAFNLGVGLNGSTIIAGTLSAGPGLQTPGTRLNLEFRSLQQNTSPTGDPIVLGTVSLVTNANGDAFFALQVDNSIDGEFLEIIVRDQFGLELSRHVTNRVGPNASGNRAFVSQLVNDLLFRDRDILSGGVIEFSNLEGMSRPEIVNALVTSAEYDAITAFSIYLNLLGRAPTTNELNIAVNNLQAGVRNNVLRLNLLISDEFYFTRGGNSNDGYISAVYSTLLGRAPTPQERNLATLYLLEGGRRAMVNLVLGTPEYNDVLVVRLYNQLYGRSPNGTELAQASGILDAGFSEDALLSQLLSGGIAATGNSYYFDSLVRSTYRDYLQRDPNAGELNAAIGALLGGQTEQAFRAGLLASLEFYNNADLEVGVVPPTDEEFVRDLFRDVLGQPNPAPASVDALLNLRSSFSGLVENDPNSPNHINWRRQVANNLLAQDRTLGVGPLAAAGNDAPFLAALSDLTIGYSQGSVTLALSANDFNGDNVQFSARVRSPYADLKALYGFNTPDQFFNANGLGEKWLLGNDGWYFLLSNGSLYKYLGSGPIGNNRWVTFVGQEVYNNPSLLYNASQGDAASFDYFQNLLKITPNNGFTGSFIVDVTATDGKASTTQSFTVTVTNQAPTIAPIADKVINHQVDSITVPVNSNDLDGDDVTLTATAVSRLGELRLQYGLNTPAQFINANGVGEKWLAGNNGWYFLLPDGNLYQYLGSGPISNRQLLTFVGQDVYNDPSLLYNAFTGNVANLSFSGGNLTVDPVDGFVGTFTVTVTASDGAQSSSTSFNVTVQNAAPTIAPIGDQVVSHSQELRVTVSTADADNDPVTVTAELQNPLWNLRSQYGFNTPAQFFNANGLGEKWLAGNDGWYFLLSNGNLYKYLGSGSIGNNRLVTTVGQHVYNDPSLLYNASPSVGSAVIDGDELVITPPAGYLGQFTAVVTASDGTQSTTQSFKVSVVNNAPTLAPIADQQISGDTTLTLSASDAENDSLTYSAEIVSDAFNVGRQLGLKLSGGLFFNANGLQEKWLQGNGGVWYFLLPTGNLFQYLGSGSIGNNRFVASVGPAAWANPEVLYDANYLANIGSVFVVGDELHIEPNSGFAGSFQVKVTVSDGSKSDVKFFSVTVEGASAGSTSESHDPHQSGSGSNGEDDSTVMDDLMAEMDDEVIAMLGFENYDDDMTV